MNRDEKAVYDKVYGEDEKYAVPHKAKIDYVIKWCMDKSSVLDAGCGRGEYMRAVMDIRPVVEIVGIELSTVCCDKFLQDLPHQNTSIQEYCTGGYLLDGVYCTDVLEHIPTDELSDVLEGMKKISNKFLLLVATGSDKRDGIELHISNFTFDEWHSKISQHMTITKAIRGFDEWPYIHIFECEGDK